MKQQILEAQLQLARQEIAELRGSLLVSRELSAYLLTHLREVTPEDAFEQLHDDAHAHVLLRFADHISGSQEEFTDDPVGVAV